MTCVSDRSPPKAGPAVITILLAAVAFVAGASLTAHAQKTPATQVIADDASSTVRIVVAGRTVAVFDGDGLHVRGAIEYGGTLTDFGATNFDAKFGNSEGGRP